jgi:putative ABC transport system ATP-binding protein
MIRVENLCRTYGAGETQVIALSNVSLHIKEGEFVAVMGASGSGKSTLMNIRNKKIVFIFQTFHLLTRLSAQENVALPLRYTDTPKQQASERAMAMLDKVGLQNRAHHKPFEMSGGQRQRVAIARALVNEPKVIFADEPTGNLDSKTSHEIMQLLCSLHQQGHTLVMVTHEEDIAAYAKRIIRMKDGIVIEDSGC